jgi:hypothetical protein
MYVCVCVCVCVRVCTMYTHLVCVCVSHSPTHPHTHTHKRIHTYLPLVTAVTQSRWSLPGSDPSLASVQFRCAAPGNRTLQKVGWNVFLFLGTHTHTHNTPTHTHTHTYTQTSPPPLFRSGVGRLLDAAKRISYVRTSYTFPKMDGSPTAT